MMAWRIAYCKVNYPLAYYAAYFGIRAIAFSYEIMCQGKGKAAILYAMTIQRRIFLAIRIRSRMTMKDMHIVQEMYARGFEFMPIDII